MQADWRSRRKKLPGGKGVLRSMRARNPAIADQPVQNAHRDSARRSALIFQAAGAADFLFMTIGLNRIFRRGGKCTFLFLPLLFVIPANAGNFQPSIRKIPACAGMTTISRYDDDCMSRPTLAPPIIFQNNIDVIRKGY
jgi:hypothetical protein